MPIITTAEVINQFRLPSEIGATQLDGAVAFAEQTLKGWLPTATYTDAAGGSPANTDRAKILKLAGGYLAMHEALPLIAARVRQDGVTLSEHSEIGRVLNYLTPAGIAEQQALYWSEARRLSAPYNTDPADDLIGTVPAATVSTSLRNVPVW